MDGIINLLKPPGMSSNNAVYDVRKIFGEKHAGHMGTLDPAAAGVLPICLGRATRLFDYLLEKEKTYVAEITLGAATDTQDAVGKVLKRAETHVTRKEFLQALAGFRGETSQVAPAYSALKVDGRKMYDLARAGETVPEKVRSIRISELELLSADEDRQRFMIRVTCSRGTYIRTLCENIGESLEAPAYMSFLLRTAAGPFLLEETVTIDDLRLMKEQGMLLKAVRPCEDVLSFLPAIHLPEERRIPAMNGLPTTVRGEDRVARLYAGERFLGVGTVIDRSVKLSVHLYEQE